MSIKQTTQDGEPTVTLEMALGHGLSAEEYERIVQILGRVPTYTELGIYSVMWSEHCSYKNSVALLKTLPRTGHRLLVGAGEENAGLVDIGDGLAVVFKIESHNHPSAVEPYQGAATGVGGILRDIFTMGARPVATLNSLRFGELGEGHTHYLFKSIVKGIGDYGNSFGVPTVGGEVSFERPYRDNPLVNAMAVGIVEHGSVARAIARGIGNPVMIVGSATGRDGIHGATFASEEISEHSGSKRPSVQVGDPFTEKLLLEATLEAIRSGYVVGIQDMGAAGLTCSSAEMSAKGNVGMNLYLEKVPTREEGMTSYEIMLSESQERMLLVVQKGHEGDIQGIFDKWDLPAVPIGSVKGDGKVSVFLEGELRADVPANTLVLGGGAPVYNREARRPDYLDQLHSFRPESLGVPKDLTESFLDLLSSPVIASKRWVYEQYDSMVRTNSVVTPGADAAVIRIKGTDKGLALTTDCNARYVYLDPRRGAEIAVAESARNVVCVGARPLAITNCLNFGNPYDPEIYWQFKQSVEGMGAACRAFDTPVTGGNVSFYNESPEHAVYPTPVIGMLGLIEDIDGTVTPGFKDPDDIVVLLGRNRAEVGGSEYVYKRTGLIQGTAPALDLGYERRLHESVLELIGTGSIRSAHDVSEGGIAVTLAECCFAAPKGTGFRLRDDFDYGVRPDFFLFGESQSLVVISSNRIDFDRIADVCRARRIDYAVIGRTTGEGRIELGNAIDVATEEASHVYEGAIGGLMEKGRGM